MFYIPGHGGYFFSTEPVDQPPFLGVGVVDGKHLTFTIDNETYDCTAQRPDSGACRSGAVMGVSRSELQAGRQLD